MSIRLTLPPSARDIASGLDDHVSDLARAAEQLRGGAVADALVGLLRVADGLTVAALQLVRSSSARIEYETGLPAEATLRLLARRTDWDARELCSAADALAAMPRTADALTAGKLTWSQARALLRAAREVRLEQRGELDDLIGCRADELAAAAPEQIVREVEDHVIAVDEQRAARREETAHRSSFLVLAPRFDGGGRLYGEADVEAFSSILEAIDSVAERPRRDEDGKVDDRLRSRQRMQAFVQICEQSLGGSHAGPGTRPQPRVLAAVDVSKLEDGIIGAARILRRLTGHTPRLSKIGTETLLCDAEIVPIVFDGARPIAVGDAHKPVRGKLRAAIVARDQGCRFPGCSMPAVWSDAHHVVRKGKPTSSNDPANLLLLCRRCHRRIHSHQWTINVQPCGTIRFTHGRRTHISPPRTARRE